MDPRAQALLMKWLWEIADANADTDEDAHSAVTSDADTLEVPSGDTPLLSELPPVTDQDTTRLDQSSDQHGDRNQADIGGSHSAVPDWQRQIELQIENSPTFPFISVKHSCNNHDSPHFCQVANRSERVRRDIILSAKESQTLCHQESLPMAMSLGVCLVVGGSGFLGRDLVKMLRAQDCCTSITVLDLQFPDYSLDGVRFFKGDITKKHEVESILEQVRPEVIINAASPHAYLDHKYAHLAMEVNVQGCMNLLDVAAALGTVKNFVYTSSAPIIAGSGHAYSFANEKEPTLATSGTGDQYHVAKAKADQLVLDRNGKHGMKTVCIRPTAIYGDGDKQMMPATLALVGTWQMGIWMGDNENFMDVVYVGNVSRALILAAHALVQCHVDSAALKVDGEAFNITDGAPANPWTFFGYFWSAAGDTTSVKNVWMIKPSVVMAMAHAAEMWTWLVSLGKRRPKLLTVERMEFCLLTRTYCIDKAKRMLGYVPWEGVQYKNQLDAIRGTVSNYVKLHPEIFGWPEHPFKLISDTGAKDMFGPPVGHACIELARHMALVHNTIFRGLNAIYLQAGLVKVEYPSSTSGLSLQNVQQLGTNVVDGVLPGTPTSMQSDLPAAEIIAAVNRFTPTTSTGCATRPNSISGETPRMLMAPGDKAWFCEQDVQDLLLYCGFATDFLHHHHTFEEKYLFPALEEAMRMPGHFEHEITDHHELENKLDRLRAYAMQTTAKDYSAARLRALIDDFAPALQQHMDSELEVLLSLHTVNSSKLQKIYKAWYSITGRHSDMFKAGPLVFGCQDRNFLVDGQKITYPHEPIYVPYIISWIISRKHSQLWRFNPSDFYGRPRRPGLQSVAAGKSRQGESIVRSKVMILTMASVAAVIFGVVRLRNGGGVLNVLPGVLMAWTTTRLM